ncbi:MAG: hypothetical protein NTU69_07630 [Proteobacteria bacterium]|nr:hypothetical protein [Pseudomonadota bacterium]
MHPSILRNTLVSESSIEKILLLPREDSIYASLLEILTKFQDIKDFASEIHTETNLIKPVLKNLGYAYESKPKFFEEYVKSPDVALFTSEEERIKGSRLWGTSEYYNNVLGILLLKRYGRNLQEGIGGFYLEFENRIPIYQIIYLLKKSKTPWGILTNGKNWILVKKPVLFEKRIIEIDIETSLIGGNEEALHLFYQIFSLSGLKTVIPAILEEERIELIGLLKEKKDSTQKSIKNLKKRVEIYPRITNAFRELFPESNLPLTEDYLREKRVELMEKNYTKPKIINEYNVSDISSYLFNKREPPTVLNLEEIILQNKDKDYTKEGILSQKILDMTPGFGNLTAQLLESFAYTSFTLPYKGKNTFVAEWEDEITLKGYIIENLLYGIERSHLSLDILQNMMSSLFNSRAKNYKLGNPLLGMSIKDITDTLDTKNQMGLFNRHPRDIIQEFKEMYKLYFSLSEKIKEDLEIKNELEVKLTKYRERIKDILDIITTTYFYKMVENKRIQDMLFSLDSDESTWDVFRKKDWFVDAKKISKRNGFFHLEIEFPFLLNNAFDFIFIQPALNYTWEEELPLTEVTKAYIKRGMPYLKQQGKLVIILEDTQDVLVPELKKSKRYEIEIKNGLAILTKKNN